MKPNFFQCEFKEVELKEGKIKIKGFASTPDIDRYNDIVEPKAFNTAMSWYMNNPVILLQHNTDKPIGKTIEYILTKRWLEIKVELTNDIDNTFKLIQDWVLKGFSIGFIPKKWNFETKDQLEVRQITDLDLIEISVVSTPANPNSLFTLTKSVKNFFDNLDEEIDWTNLITNNITMEEVKLCDEVEITSENLVETTEEVIENITEEVVEDEAQENEELKALKEVVETQKIEMEEIKKSLQSQTDLLNNVLDNVIELSKKTQENKSVLDNLPIKKWLATLWLEKKTIDPLFQELMNARNKF
jgi:HK97 family phage prohead protease